MDKRVKNSIANIKRAMIKCLKSVSLDKITVSQICKEAKINRSTFYAHFTDPISLYKQIEEDLTSFVLRDVDSLNKKRTTYEELIHSAVNYYGKHSDYIMVLLNTNSESFKNVCMEYVDRTRVINIEDENLKRYYEDFFVSGLFSVVKRWIENGKKESPDEISNLILDWIGRDGK